MIVVTGGAGFIGSNLVHGLNAHDRDDIVVVDNLERGEKFFNIRDANIDQYLDQDEFLDWLVENGDDGVDAIFHLGASSDTTEWNGRYMMENNYAFSKGALDIAIAYQIPFIYASSAAVYGMGTDFKERIGKERPLNVYGYTKALFDRYVERQMQATDSQIAGLRYFNVYGPGETHKGRMASIAYHHYRQLHAGATVKLFGEYDGYSAGEQKRDFVYVDDVVSVNLWLLDHPQVSGVFNCGTGAAESFNEVANAVTRHFGYGGIEYIPFPDDLRGAYQSYTEADLNALRAAGYTGTFRSVSDGVADYMKWLDANAPASRQGG
ncbi:ADP-glyceromanno-heptose 6-epimerase [Spiribacter vilamensis]|uniref:ADP-L-glycero-D-manno-heptose-6-epimerase n=1 Tax=Spiribacter vilamensis TaxID=531306 RepID=A0A4Q8D289_9GAMM|nr:ADP-glyceromanno-heptose 6-epimerase [Spiribacter vilamensis]RZU99410.1 ADP-glyceromanno-heptose 6-epimerase precursor [Spiribacter vilamensis]TVO61615.1 ADP-glyceromanno-heptose 6-epimerase [Spiribacter vilamensis]